jgi:uncharacterized membrane protein
MRIDAPVAERQARLPWIDAARGIAIFAMVVYHFSWDLGNFGFIAADVGRDLGWVIFARLIAGSFLFLVGVSLVLSTRHGLDRTRFLTRLCLIVAGAIAVSLVTWIVTPDNFVFFGILHSIAVASILGLAFIHVPAPVTAITSVAWFLIWWFISHPLFDEPALLWVGLGTVPPQTNDYVPIFPWFGVVLAGMALTKLALTDRAGRKPVTDRLSRPAPWWLVWAGRNSLAIYLIHQPVLYGLTYLAALAIPADMETFRARYTENCVRQCVALDADAEYCRRACSCVAREAAEAGLATALARNLLGTEDRMRYNALTQQCIEDEGSLTPLDDSAT